MIKCPIKKAETQPETLTRDDAYFWSFVKPEARPSTLYEVSDSDDDDDQEEEVSEHGDDMDE